MSNFIVKTKKNFRDCLASDNLIVCDTLITKLVEDNTTLPARIIKRYLLTKLK